MLFTGVGIGPKLTTFILRLNCSCACIYRTSDQTQVLGLIWATTETKLHYFTNYQQVPDVKKKGRGNNMISTSGACQNTPSWFFF